MNIRDDLKAFYVGDRQGTAIYVGSTKVWPICNPQMVTVANPVPQGTTIVDPCNYVFSNYDGTADDIQRDWIGRGSAQTYADVKLNSGDLSRKGNLFTESHFDLNNLEITNLNQAYGR